MIKIIIIIIIIIIIVVDSSSLNPRPERPDLFIVSAQLCRILASALRSLDMWHFSLVVLVVKSQTRIITPDSQFPNPPAFPHPVTTKEEFNCYCSGSNGNFRLCMSACHDSGLLTLLRAFHLSNLFYLKYLQWVRLEQPCWKIKSNHDYIL